MKYQITILNEDGSLTTFGGYASNQADALANVSYFHGTQKIVKIEFEQKAGN
jgi:hypothetical protein